MKYIINDCDEKALKEKIELINFYDTLAEDKREKFMKFICVLKESLEKKKAS